MHVASATTLPGRIPRRIGAEPVLEKKTRTVLSVSRDGRWVVYEPQDA